MKLTTQDAEFLRRVYRQIVVVDRRRRGLIGLLANEFGISAEYCGRVINEKRRLVPRGTFQ